MGMDDQPLAPIEHPLFQMARMGMVSALDRLYFRSGKWDAAELLEQLELSKEGMEAELRRVNDPMVRLDRYSWDVAYVRGAVWSMINEKLNNVSADEIAPNRVHAADWRTMVPWIIIASIILVLALFLKSIVCEINYVC